MNSPQNEALSRRAALSGTIAASSVAPIALLSGLPASLRWHHPAHPVGEASFCDEF
jgi:hypothetical protein